MVQKKTDEKPMNNNKDEKMESKNDSEKNEQTNNQFMNKYLMNNQMKDESNQLFLQQIIKGKSPQ